MESKLRPPPARPGTVRRTRLLRRLAADPGAPIVAIVGPPGYGKTTLLAQWVEDDERPTAWLTIDDFDNDPAVLLANLAVAFDRISPVDAAFGAVLVVPPERLLATAVPRLAAELHRWERPGLLVLDEAHRLADRTVLDALAGLLDHLPPGFRVAIAGRSAPDLPFARWRAQGSLLEIGTDLLALDEKETAGLVAATGRAFEADEVRALAARAEGWAAGIYLATLAEPARDVGAGTTVGVSGRDRYIAAYLRSEIERALDDDDVTVLTRTAILDTVTPAVAEVVAGVSGAAERLRSLARRILLVHPLDDAEGSYRYHHLLRDFLLAELERREPRIAPELHRRAASWYAAEGSVERAIAHANAAGDVDLAARLVTGAALPVFYGGRAGTLDRWLQAFDDRVFERHPGLAVIAAWVHLLTGRAGAADRMADIAERSALAGPPGDGSASFESQRAMLRAVMARRGPRDVLANAELAVAAEGPTSPWRANALWLLGSAWMLLGDVGAADAAFAAAAAAGTATAMVARAKRASIAIARGDWASAEEHVRGSEAELARANYGEIGAALIVHAVAARVAIQRGDLAHGREELVRAQVLRPLASEGAPWYYVDASLELARAYLAVSDPPGAQGALRAAEQIARRRPRLGALTGELIEMRRRLADVTYTLAGSSTLTTAELRVLPLLPTYLSYQDVADRLHVSRNTVKTHAMSIYGKLGASSRAEAVERAVELGLLEPYPALGSARPRPAD